MVAMRTEVALELHFVLAAAHRHGVLARHVLIERPIRLYPAQDVSQLVGSGQTLSARVARTTPMLSGLLRGLAMLFCVIT